MYMTFKWSFDIRKPRYFVTDRPVCACEYMYACACMYVFICIVVLHNIIIKTLVIYGTQFFFNPDDVVFIMWQQSCR